MEIPQKQIKGRMIQVYNDEFKRRICKEYLNGTASKMGIPLAQVFRRMTCDKNKTAGLRPEFEEVL